MILWSNNFNSETEDQQERSQRTENATAQRLEKINAASKFWIIAMIAIGTAGINWQKIIEYLSKEAAKPPAVAKKKP